MIGGGVRITTKHVPELEQVISSITSGVSVVASAPVSKTSRLFVDPWGPAISASTMISSRLRTKGLESFAIEEPSGSIHAPILL